MPRTGWALTFVVNLTARVAGGRILAGAAWLGRAQQDRVVGVGLDVLLEVLRPLERFAAEIALVRLQRHVHTDVRRDVVALDRGGAAVAPLAGQVEVVGAFAADVSLTHLQPGLANIPGC